MSPIGPVVTTVANVTGSPVFDATLRFHHMPSDRLGWTLQADLTAAAIFDMQVSHFGVRGGPRFSLRQRGLSDWTVTPFATVGVTSLSALDRRLARYGVLGVGVEAGRTWVWRRLAMELGLGVYTAFPVGFSTPAEAMQEQKAVNLSPIKPSVTWSLGYAF